MYYFTKNWLATLSAVVFMFGSVFAQELSPQQKDQMDKAAYELEMQNYQPKMPVEEAEEGFMLVGEGSEIDGTPSWGNYYLNQTTQTLYKKSELGGKMLIKSIAWNFERIPAEETKRTWANVSVRLKEVDLEAMSSNFVDMEGAVEVYAVDSLQGPSESGWFTIDIEDYEYSGQKNLIVEVAWGANSGWTSGYYRTYKTNSQDGSNRVVYNRHDNTPSTTYLTSSLFENLKIEMQELAAEETTFNIVPESYNFGNVGIFDGAVMNAEQAEATFKIKNKGPGTITIEEAPYLFSADADQFEVVTEATFPYAVEGPFVETENALTFKVKFNPTSVGEKSTLLVVKDDMDRVVRTFPISGTAYNVLDGDIMENAIEINQNWPEENDYTAEGSFEGYYNDYDVLGESPDKVYKFTTVQDSYFNFLNVEGIEDLAVYAEGDEFTVENNVYDGSQIEIGIGTFYVVIAGTGDYAFTMHVEGRDPIFEITPTSLDLGEVPIGAFHYGGKFVLKNVGGQSITINDVTVSDENGAFEVEGHYEYPFELTTQEMVFYVHCNATATGTFTASLLVDEEGATTHIYPITATTYVPEEGDVAEMPYEITVEGAFTHEASLVNPPMRKNYLDTEEDLTDAVYHFTFEEDKIININVDGLENANMALYDVAALRVINPTVIEPVAEGSSFENMKLWKGEYYLILSGEQAPYTLNISETTMPNPTEIVLVAPENGDNNVVLNPVLEWEQANEYTQYIDVYLDTQYPPVNKVVTNGNPADTMYQATNLAPAQIYFWKVVAKNGNATVESEIRAFTTTLPPPTLVNGSIVDFDNVHLTWQSPFTGEMLFVEDFEGGELPEGWEQSTLATSNTAGWRFGDDLGSDSFSIPGHTMYAAANDDAPGDGSDGSQDYLITRSYDLSSGESARLSFASYYTGNYGQLAHVKISVNQGEWQLLQDLTPADAWTNVEIDLSEYIAPENTDVRILFHSDDAGQWGSGWAIDDVVLGIGISNDFVGVNATLLGYNVYQNGEKLNTDLVTEIEYDVNDLPVGDYIFGVSAVYPQGESEIITIDEISILGRGMVEGTVTDGDTEEVIAGAGITFTAKGMEGIVYETTTDENGHYTIEVPVVVEGYDAEAAFEGYQPNVQEVMAVATQTVTLDFVLGDVPVAPANVVAEIVSEETVKVYWGMGSPAGDEFSEDFENGLPADWMIIDNDGDGYNWENRTDFTAHGGVGTMSSASYINDINSAVNPDNYLITPQVAIGGTSVLKFWMVAQDTNWPGDIVKIKVSTTTTEPSAFTEVATLETTPEYVQHEVDLSAYAGQQVYIAFNHTDCTDKFYVNIDDVELTNARQVNAPATTYYQAQATVAVPFKTAGMNQAQIEEQMALYKANQTVNTREFKSYSVYRTVYDATAEEPVYNWELLAEDLTDTVYMDNTWGDLGNGAYKYAVKSVYTVTESELVLSNRLTKGLFSDVFVFVNLNTEESAEGAQVVLTGLEVDSTYTGTIGAEGNVHFPAVWVGPYTLTVSKEGFMTTSMETTFANPTEHRTIELQEALCMPVNLMANTACADVTLSWSLEDCSGGNTTGSGITEGFEDAFPPEGWEVVNNCTDQNWQQVETVQFGSGDVAPHEGSKQLELYWSYNAQDEWVITPEFTCGAGFNVNFWTYITYGSTNGDHYYVKVSTDGGASWNEVWDASAQPQGDNHYDNAVTVDLNAYAGQNIKVAWNGYGDAGLWYAWFIDDITIGNSREVYAFNGQALTRKPVEVIRSSSQVQYSKDNSVQVSNEETRSLTGYKVYRDGTLLTSEPITESTYTDEAVEAGTYNYTVMAVYSTGNSEMSEAVEVSIEEMLPVENLSAEKIGTDNIRIYWDGSGNDNNNEEEEFTLQYDNGTNSDAIGLTGGGSFDVAAKFSTSAIQNYNGMELRKIAFFPYAQGDFIIKVWQGEGTPTLIYEQATTVTAEQWNEVTLNTPVVIDASQALWIGYNVTHADGVFPAGCDAGPNVAGGDMINLDGWAPISTLGSFDLNWNLAGTIVGTRGEELPLVQYPALDNTLPANPQGATLANKGEAADALSYNEMFGMSRALTGYKLYRKNTEVDSSEFELVDGNISASATQCFDENLTSGTYVYHLVSVYNNSCESAISNETGEVVIDIATDDIKDNLNVYPNPVSEVLTIKVSNEVSNIVIVNQLGQVVYTNNNVNEDKLTINVNNYANGTYFVKFMSDSKVITNKRFMVVK